MADRYWVGGSGNWEDTSHWAASSGGSGGASVPSQTDYVFFDNASFPDPGAVVNYNSYDTIMSFSANSGITWKPTLNVNGYLTVRTNGSLRGLSMIGGSGMLIFSATSSPASINLQDVYVGCNVRFESLSSSASWDLNGNLNIPDTFGLYVGLGTLRMNGYNVNAGALYASSGTINFDSGTHRFNQFNLSSNVGVLTNGGKISITGSLFYGGGKQYGDVEFVSTVDSVIVIGDTGNTFANMSITGSYRNLIFPDLTTITQTLAIAGVGPGNHKRVVSNARGVQAEIKAGALALSYVTFRDIKATGAAVWDTTAIPGGGGSAGGNTGITFPGGRTLFWVGGATGGTWTSANKWSLTSGGVGNQSYPRPQDQVIFNALSITGSGNPQITCDCTEFFGLDSSAVTAGAFFSFTYAPIVHSHFKLGAAHGGGSGVNLTFENGGTLNMAGNSRLVGTLTINTFADEEVLIQDGKGARISHVSGILKFSGNTELGSYSSVGTLSRTLDIQNIILTFTGFSVSFSVNDATNYTVLGTSSRLVFSPSSTSNATFFGAGLLWNIVELAGTGTGALQFQNACSVNELVSATPGRILEFSSFIFRVKKLTVNGSVVSGVTKRTIMRPLNNSTSPWRIQAIGSDQFPCDYLQLSYSKASPDYTFFAGTHSLNVAGNTGWRWTDPVPRPKGNPFKTLFLGNIG